MRVFPLALAFALLFGSVCAYVLYVSRKRRRAGQRALFNSPELRAAEIAVHAVSVTLFFVAFGFLIMGRYTVIGAWLANDLHFLGFIAGLVLVTSMSAAAIKSIVERRQSTQSR
jgi:membrane associated rhomboid family serine protease